MATDKIEEASRYVAPIVASKFAKEVVCKYMFSNLLLVFLKILPQYIHWTCKNFILGCSSHSHNSSRYYVRFPLLAFYYKCSVSYSISIGKNVFPQTFGSACPLQRIYHLSELGCYTHWTELQYDLIWWMYRQCSCCGTYFRILSTNKCPRI